MDRGELPGYEFEVPRGPRHASGPRHMIGHDSLRYLQRSPTPEPGARSSVRAAGSGVFNIMRKRNWLMCVAAPILAAIAVGVAVVVVAGGGGASGDAPSALAAGFPPARLAGPGFAGSAGMSQVVLTAIGASAATEVTAGSVDGGPALWTSSDGGTDWTRAVLHGPASLTRTGTGQFAGVAHGPAGWLAVGTTLASDGGPLVASSVNARAWTVAGGSAGLGEGNPVAVAAGHAGYVIVGHRSPADSGTAVAAAWYASGLTGWRPAAITPTGQDSQMMNAVTATAHGFVAVGGTGTSPAAWLSATGRGWRQVRLPAPAGAARAALDFVAANGSTVLAAGTEFSTAGASRPFVEASANAGTTWTEVQLPVPGTSHRAGTTVTGLTAAKGGFTAVGTYVTRAGPEVVIWTLPPRTPVTDGAAWATVTPQGTGLASTKAENALTALTVDGVTLTGVGYTAALSTSGTPEPQQPTLWQSPVRY